MWKKSSKTTLSLATQRGNTWTFCSPLDKRKKIINSIITSQYYGLLQNSFESKGTTRALHERLSGRRRVKPETTTFLIFFAIFQHSQPTLLSVEGFKVLSRYDETTKTCIWTAGCVIRSKELSFTRHLKRNGFTRNMRRARLWWWKYRYIKIYTYALTPFHLTHVTATLKLIYIQNVQKREGTSKFRFQLCDRWA